MTNLIIWGYWGLLKYLSTSVLALVYGVIENAYTVVPTALHNARKRPRVVLGEPHALRNVPQFQDI